MNKNEKPVARLQIQLGCWLILGLLLGILWSGARALAWNPESVVFSKWSRVELQFSGPALLGMGSPNPFQIRVDVTFTSPDGREFIVPAFFDGDGQGGLNGNVWKARFSPDAAGTWEYVSDSANALLDGQSGSFQVVDDPECSPLTIDGLPNFACVGRLEYASGHYLKFAEGPYWVKAGTNEPEDFLVPGVNAGFATKEAAIDFLAECGVNSIYLMMNNIDGDRRDIWPWVGATQAEARLNHERFDVARLLEWERIFTYIESKGLVLHIVFEDDSAWTGFNRGMYYREMVARFGHHNGLYWDLAEEYNEVYTADQIKSFAQSLRDLDPYGHPITVHQQGDLTNWDPFLGDVRFDLTSFQVPSSPQNTTAVSWFNKVERSGKTIPIAFDESTNALSANDRGLIRHILWSILTGGGYFEIYPVLASNGYRGYDRVLEDVGRGRALLDSLPFWQMRPENRLLSGSPGYVFAQEGEAYLVYLPSGRSFRLDLTGTSNRFEAAWFNPGDGSMQSIDLIQGGEEVNFVAPDGNDWALILRRYLGVHPEITSTPPLQAQVNQVYRYDVEAIGDPSPNFALLSAPAGMTIDPGSGLIQWVPAISGNFAVTVEARNTAGSDTQTFTVQVAAPTTLTPTRTLTSQPTRTPTPMLTHLPTRTATITPKPSATPIGQTSPTPTRRPKPPGQSIFLPLVTH